MFRGLIGQGGRRLGVAVLSAAVTLAASGQALAGDGDRHNGLVIRVGSHEHGHHGHHHGHGHHHHSSHGHYHHRHHHHHHGGSFFSFSIGSGIGSYYRRDHYPPVIVSRPEPIIIRQPEYVRERVIVQEPAPVVIEKPVIVERPVERVIEKPVYIERQSEADAAASGNYRDRELGDAYLRMADWHNAVRVYKRYLSAWDKDGTAVRNLGLAQVGAGQVQEGFRNVVRGYELEPGLMDRAMRVSDFGGGGAGLRALIDAAVHGADATNTAEGWFTVAVLRSIAGEDEAALEAVKRARDAGLKADMLDQLTLRVGGASS